MFGLTCAYELRSQVTEKALPLLLRAPGVALAAPDELIMVISSSVKDEITPDVDPADTVEPESVQVLKCDSG